jgi:hypothetical protein
MRKLLPAILFLLLSFSVTAQTAVPKTDSIKPEIKKTTVTVLGGAIFSSLLHYYGRTDNLKSSALLPTVLVQFDSIGLYASSTAVLINNRTQTLDYAGTITELGYRFGKKVKGFGGNVYGNKFFYNNTSELPQSAFKEQAGANLYYLSKYINFTATGSAAFADKTDFFASAGINHIFKYKKDKNLFIAIPTFVANAGTQNFTAFKNPEDQTTYSNNSRFNMLDYELSVPLIYARKHIYIIVTPTYVIPVNIITVPGHPEISETASNIFFATFTFLYSFKM